MARWTPTKISKPSSTESQTSNFSKNPITTLSNTNRSLPPFTEPSTATANMSEEIEVPTNILPKDVSKDVGTIKLFNKWDYDVEVRDISLTYVYAIPWDGAAAALRCPRLDLVLTD